MITKTAIGYLRVSTEGQATEGISLVAQRAKIEAWCQVNDIELSGIYVDAGVSGKRADNRPQLQTALEEVCRTRGVLVVYSLSRLARSTKDTIQIAERLGKASCDLVSLSEKIDTTSAAGKMIFQMLAVLAEFERNQISERTRAVLQHKRSQGRRVGQIPFGYTLADDGESLIQNESEQRVIALLDQLRSDGLSYSRIAAELNQRAVPTKEEGGRWGATTVMRILKRMAA